MIFNNAPKLSEMVPLMLAVNILEYDHENLTDPELQTACDLVEYDYSEAGWTFQQIKDQYADIMVYGLSLRNDPQ